MRILAIDPGRTTGVAWADIDRTWQVTNACWMQYETYNKSDIKMLLDIIHTVLADVVVMEDFITRTLAADVWPLTIIHIIQWEFEHGNYWEGRHTGTLAMQQPAERSVINDSRLKRMELYQPGQPHANDAMRHLVVYSRKMRVNGTPTE